MEVSRYSPSSSSPLFSFLLSKYYYLTPQTLWVECQNDLEGAFLDPSNGLILIIPFDLSFRYRAPDQPNVHLTTLTGVDSQDNVMIDLSNNVTAVKLPTLNNYTTKGRFYEPTAGTALSPS